MPRPPVPPHIQVLHDQAARQAKTAARLSGCASTYEMAVAVLALVPLVLCGGLCVYGVVWAAWLR